MCVCVDDEKVWCVEVVGCVQWCCVGEFCVDVECQFWYVWYCIVEVVGEYEVWCVGYVVVVVVDFVCVLCVEQYCVDVCVLVCVEFCVCVDFDFLND